MSNHLFSRQGAAWIVVTAALMLPAMASRADDVPRVAPKPASIPVPDLAEVGRAHSLAVRGDMLYVGATGGLAAIDATGKVQWTLKLPPVSARTVQADAEHVAYSSYDIVGLVAGSGATAALMWGDPSRKVEVASADAGLVTLQGQAVWSVKFDEPSALSVPALGKTAVVVVGAKSARFLDRSSGATLADVSMFTNWLGISGNHATRVAVTPALWLGDEVFAAHQYWFKKLDAKGGEIVAKRRLRSIDNAGLMAGPTLCKDLLMVGEAAYPMGTIFTGKKARIYALSAKGEATWNATLDDEVGGVGSLACNDELIFAAANALVVAFDRTGKAVWEASNDRAGRLFPGTHRGVVRIRDFFNNAGPAVARAVTAGQQMLVAGPYLYITTRAQPKADAAEDLLTILDAKTGAFIEAVELKTQVIDMAVFGDGLALATGDGLKLIALKRP